MLTSDEKEVLVSLICEKQSNIIIKDCNEYKSKEYIDLESLKVKIKSIS